MLYDINKKRGKNYVRESPCTGVQFVELVEALPLQKIIKKALKVNRHLHSKKGRAERYIRKSRMRSGPPSLDANGCYDYVGDLGDIRSKSNPVVVDGVKYRIMVSNYSFSNKELQFGRVFADNKQSGQKIGREFRHELMAVFYRDVDIENCHPVIYLHLCRKWNLPSAAAERYVNERESLLAELMEATNCTRGQAKSTFLTILNGGSRDYDTVMKECKDSPIKEFLKKYRNEVSRNLQYISEMKEFKKLKDAKIESGKEHNIEGSVLNLIFCEYEHEMLEIMMQYFLEKRVSPPELPYNRNEVRDMILCFDGLLIPKYYNSCEEDFREIERRIEYKLDMSVRITHKKMDEFIPWAELDAESKEPESKEPESKEQESTVPSVGDSEVDTDDEDFDDPEGDYDQDYDEPSDNEDENYDEPDNEPDEFEERTFRYFGDFEHIKTDLAVGGYAKTLRWFNKTGALIRENGDIILYMKKHNEDTNEDVYKKAPFLTYRRTLEQRVYTGASKKNPYESIGKILQNLQILGKLKNYRSLFFKPYLYKKDLGAESLNHFNLFPGFKYQELRMAYKKEGRKFLDFESSVVRAHIRDIICVGDERKMNWLDGFIAHMIQKPYEVPRMALFLYSESQGAGKGMLISILEKLIGHKHTLIVTNPKNYFNNFNGSQENKIIICFDELAATKNEFKVYQDRLKADITGESHIIEKKGLEQKTVRNFARLIFLSNHKNVLYIEPTDRRYVCMATSNEKAPLTGDDKTAYFGPLGAYRDNDETMVSMFNYYAEYDLSKWRMDAISTPLKVAMKAYNTSNTHRFLTELCEAYDNNVEDEKERLDARREKDELEEAPLTPEELSPFPREVPAVFFKKCYLIERSELFKQYTRFCIDEGERAVQNKTFKEHMLRLGIEVKRFRKTTMSTAEAKIKGKHCYYMDFAKIRKRLRFE